MRVKEQERWSKKKEMAQAGGSIKKEREDSSKEGRAEGMCVRSVNTSGPESKVDVNELVVRAEPLTGTAHDGYRQLCCNTGADNGAGTPVPRASAGARCGTTGTGPGTGTGAGTGTGRGGE